MKTPWGQIVSEFYVRMKSDTEWSTVLAESERDAAERYVERGEDCDTKPGEQLVEVRYPDATKWTTYRVHVEAVWTYNAEKVTDVDCDQGPAPSHG